MNVRNYAAALMLLASNLAPAQPADDPYLWLEEVTGEKAIAWVKQQNAVSQPALEASPGFKSLHERLLAIYNSRERIPTVQRRGDWLYNFWQDAANPRGLWRRTTLEEYRKKEPRWETMLDLGKLEADEKVNWAFKGAACLYPEYNRCLISLSRGGADAVEIREYDVSAKAFVKDGFRLPESKGDVSWIDKDTLYIARDFGQGSLTTSGYPRIVKEWRRGTPLAEAKVVFEGQASDVGAGSAVTHERGRRYERMQRVIQFWNYEERLRVGDRWVLLETPRDATLELLRGMLIVRLKSDWKPGSETFKAGSLVAADLDAFLAGKRDFEILFAPGERQSLQSFTATRGHLVLDILDNVKGRVVEMSRQGGKWVSRNVEVPEAASVGVTAVDRNESDDYWLTVTSFLEPTTLYLATPGKQRHEKLKSMPAFFDAKGLKAVQYEATSKDGTRVPYFVVMRADTRFDGSSPTILYGYGGFEVSMSPFYSGTIGSAWLEKGGVYALANIRGGGEFGPAWHTVAMREGRFRTHDDFIAVGEDIVKRGLSSPRHLGIVGGSQGGLLVGAAFTQRPDLFRAVVSQVPLLDMRRYNKLLAGASWMAEYGNPDEAKDWEFISKYSPYQNVSKDKKYPKVFFWTTLRDDRVHPAHARKMYARMKEQGHDVLYFEYLEGGHDSGTNPTQRAYLAALEYAFFSKELR